MGMAMIGQKLLQCDIVPRKETSCTWLVLKASSTSYSVFSKDLQRFIDYRSQVQEFLFWRFTVHSHIINYHWLFMFAASMANNYEPLSALNEPLCLQHISKHLQTFYCIKLSLEYQEHVARNEVRIMVFQRWKEVQSHSGFPWSPSSNIKHHFFLFRLKNMLKT